MSLRLKLVLALVALAAGATAAIGVFSYRTTEQQLQSQVDQSLVSATQRFGDRPADRDGFGPSPGGEFRGEGDIVVQLLAPDGDTVGYRGISLPVTATDRSLAADADSVVTTGSITLPQPR